MTVRARLLIGLIVLTAIGLGVAGSVTYRQQHDFLITQFDQRLDNLASNAQLHAFMQRALVNPEVLNGLQFSNDTAVEMRSANGTSQFSTKQNDVTLPLDPGTGYFTTSTGNYRGTSWIAPNGDVIIVAQSLKEVSSTLHHLLAVELIVALGVLVTLGMLAWWTVELGLRPLREMEDTAGAIAAGDLSRRVDVVDEHTEVGRLGIAFNEMLHQIEQAFDERAASEARLRRFVADASHELRTPLTSIRGYAELFRRGAADRPEDLAKTMRRIEQEADRMGVLVDDLLLLARLDTGRPVERTPVDLARLAQDAVDDARAVAPERPIDFASDGPVVVPGDEVRLRQVLANLMQNANRHTPPETPVHVRVRIDVDDAVLEVADEGPGMAPDDAARAFERFWRADPSRTRASGGAGLGLSIVAAIAEAHGGSASVDTNPGAGATFVVRLPMQFAEPAAADTDGESVEAIVVDEPEAEAAR